MTPVQNPSDLAPDDDKPAGRTIGGIIARVVITVMVLLIAVMWVYALFFASKKAAYRVDDDAWRAKAEQICAKYKAQRLELVDMSQGYIENPTAAQALERADVVDTATDLLQAQLDELVAVPVTSDRDRQLIATYQGYWEVVIGDRRAYTERLRRNEIGPYLETPVEGSPVTNLLSDFSVVNQAKSCAPPNELGGDT